MTKPNQPYNTTPRLDPSIQLLGPSSQAYFEDIQHDKAKAKPYVSLLARFFSSETKRTYSNQIKEAQNLHHQNMEEVHAEVETEAMVGMKHDLAKKEYSIDVPGPDVLVDMEDALGNIHKGPDVQVDTDALGNIPGIHKGPGDTLDVYKFLSSETKITYFNQIKEAPNLHHQNMEVIGAEVETEAFVGEHCMKHDLAKTT